ncbi:SH3 domain-containing protein [Yoonia sediminilitoris]|uniref:SH3 domain-containing protein n=1 Tax=Yoonia sediminilitoris TaxID=1286148 RepID=A0A2T6K5P4_9RHOB|nr:SH3 domain-containing protein [Yoonia sediminilitoris]PUB09970.1 SH3 domain-containing protein [Yoonia sediminilitoris]RCW89639.1 SH3 domain-containing protein [Yoonia sediminilitoris]
MKRILHTVAFTLCMVGTVASADEVREVTVSFAAGTTGTTLSDTIIGYDSVLYSVGAEAGQTMSVRMDASNLATYFNVYEPGRGPGDEALVVGQFTDPPNAWTGTLGLSGEYTISVYMMRSAARRNEQSNFTMDISVTGATGAVVQGDFADGLAGGPDFFAVAVAGGGSLNLRSAPSTGASTVARLSNGQNVRNLGCRMAEGRRWCNVATLADPGDVGWAAGDFLVEGTGAAVQLPATVPNSGAGGERVSFAPGTSGAELTGTLAPGDSRRYLIGANNGQNLYVRVAPQGPPISYQIFNPDGSFLVDQMTSNREYRGQLWQSGDHVIEVINRTNASANYNIIIGID